MHQENTLDEASGYLPGVRPGFSRAAYTACRRPRQGKDLTGDEGSLYNPCLGCGCDRRLFAGPRPIVERHHRTTGQGPFDAMLDSLMVHPQGRRRPSLPSWRNLLRKRLNRPPRPLRQAMTSQFSGRAGLVANACGESLHELLGRLRIVLDDENAASRSCHRFASPDHRLSWHQREIRKLTNSSGTDALVI
jgi:hypothetical protein